MGGSAEKLQSRRFTAQQQAPFPSILAECLEAINPSQIKGIDLELAYRAFDSRSGTMRSAPSGFLVVGSRRERNV
jgi:hypothetical protein